MPEWSESVNILRCIPQEVSRAVIDSGKVHSMWRSSAVAVWHEVSGVLDADFNAMPALDLGAIAPFCSLGRSAAAGAVGCWGEAEDRPRRALGWRWTGTRGHPRGRGQR